MIEEPFEDVVVYTNIVYSERQRDTNNVIHIQIDESVAEDLPRSMWGFITERELGRFPEIVKFIEDFYSIEPLVEDFENNVEEVTMMHSAERIKDAILERSAKGSMEQLFEIFPYRIGNMHRDLIAIRKIIDITENNALPKFLKLTDEGKKVMHKIRDDIYPRLQKIYIETLEQFQKNINDAMQSIIDDVKPKSEQ